MYDISHSLRSGKPESPASFTPVGVKNARSQMPPTDYSPQTTHTYFTSPTGPGSIPSINDEADGLASANFCLPHLLPLLSDHDGFLVACYSPHPLVNMLKAHTSRPVLGIMEASISLALNILPAPASTTKDSELRSARFSIVSTGKVWEEILGDAVPAFLGTGGSKKFVGVETTGLSAGQLHELPAEEVRVKMRDAAKRLVLRGADGKGVVGAVVLGCAGMSGLGEAVREGAVEAIGRIEGGKVKVVDAVVAGVALLEGILRAGF